MSSRPQIRKFPVITDGDLSQATITSSVTIIQDITVAGYSFSWVGTTPIGTIALQVSNDYELNADGRTVKNAGTWSTATINVNGVPAQSAPLTGNTGTGFIDISLMGAYAVRTVYTKTSGTGTLQAIIVGKVA